MSGDRIERVADDLVDGVQEWVRHTDDQEIRGVGALQTHSDGPWSWQVSVWVAEFLREEPLEGELRAAVDRAIRSVAGVTDVTEEDREVWIVTGHPSGEELVRAVGDAVDELAPRARAHLDTR
jgi:hypothetical protein